MIHLLKEKAKKKHIIIVLLLFGIVVISGIVLHKKCFSRVDDGAYFCDLFSVTQSSDSRWIVHPFKTDSAYVVIVPTYWDCDSLMVRFEGDETAEPLLLSGKSITHNWQKIPITIGQPQNIRFTNEQNKAEESNIVFLQSRLNTIFINTESGSMASIDASIDKSYGEEGDICVVSDSGRVDYDGKLKEIHGRGNSTWTLSEKKPYNIKFKSAVELLGMKPGKKFCLIANAFDYSHIRNAVVYHIAKSFHTSYPVDCNHAVLYLNGKYNGLYLLTNKIEIGKYGIDKPKFSEKGRNEKKWEVGFKEPVKGEVEPTKNYGAIKGGATEKEDKEEGTFLLEHVARADKFNRETSGFISLQGIPVVVKSPKKAVKEEMSYISDLYNQIESALISPNGVNPKTKKHFSDYIDVESFVKAYLIQELTDNGEADRRSFFMYKTPEEYGGKMYAGPVWDFDVALCSGADLYRYANSFVICNGAANHPLGYKGFLGQLCAHDDFMEKAKRLYVDSLYNIVKDYTENELQEMIRRISIDVKYNKMKWKEDDNYDDGGKDFKINVKRIGQFLSERSEFLYKYWSDNHALQGKCVVLLDVGWKVPETYPYMKCYVDRGKTFVPPVIMSHLWDREFHTNEGWYIKGTQTKYDTLTPVNHDMILECRWSINRYAKIKGKIEKFFSK